MTDFVASLEEEIARLAEAVEKIPEVKKLRELRRVRALYGAPESNKLGVEFPQFEINLPKFDGGNQITGGLGMRAPTGRKPSPERVKAMELIRSFIAANDMPVKTVEILEELKRQGIEIGGSDEISNLSAMISSSGEFKAHGRSGWTLKTSAERVAEKRG